MVDWDKIDDMLRTPSRRSKSLQKPNSVASERFRIT